MKDNRWKMLGMVLWTLWCAVISFFTPILFEQVFRYMSRRGYQDASAFDEGTAGIHGMILLCIWIFIALVPDALWIRKMRTYGTDFMWRGLKMIAGMVLTGCAIMIFSLVNQRL